MGMSVKKIHTEYRCPICSGKIDVYRGAVVNKSFNDTDSYYTLIPWWSECSKCGLKTPTFNTIFCQKDDGEFKISQDGYNEVFKIWRGESKIKGDIKDE